MKKDIMLVQIPLIEYTTKEMISYNIDYFNEKFEKYYDVIVVYDKNVKKIKIELVNPTLWNYIKYKFRNIFNHGK